MDEPARFAEGDDAEVYLSYAWHPVVVVHVGRWSHWSGNTYPVYTVRFKDNGAEIRCGNNSIRAKRKRKRKRKTST